MTEICTICHNNIENKNIVITECSHTFHFSCLLKNIKYNQSTGTQCPLCRTIFIPPGNFTPGNFGSYTFINRRIERSIARSVVRPVARSVVRHNVTPTIRHTVRPTIRSTVRPAIRPTVRPSVNSIIPRRVRRDRYAGKRKQIKDKIKKLTYKQLKKRLKELNLSTRGYMRTSFEKRLITHLLLVE